ncbi:carbon monoxide dehydrogenase subunit G [Methylocapsa polymorpha]|uniref:Carbon monoxide dehydrogenase subunit G n=1 Tax=Methylocapsa polymorpha TaxID=3080828 RepID=A0ABZ0HVS3_9HYPH|nr:carbon monoxide dehydrogenase subunit G [Methylocapsa sp. RX1]
MDMTGTQRIEAPREKVYAALNNVDVLKQCIPGCETIEKLSDTQMRATVTLRVGPVKASFIGMVTLSDLDPPNGYTITGEGSGGAAGFAKGGAQVRLEADGKATILNYTAKADIGGKLAQLGGRLIDSTAKKLAGDFFEKFGSVVGKPAEAQAPADTASKEGWLAKILASIGGFLQGWLGKILGSTGALLLGLGLYGHACCLVGHVHAAGAFQPPICAALSQTSPGI